MIVGQDNRSLWCSSCLLT